MYLNGSLKKQFLSWPFKFIAVLNNVSLCKVTVKARSNLARVTLVAQIPIVCNVRWPTSRLKSQSVSSKKIRSVFQWLRICHTISNSRWYRKREAHTQQWIKKLWMMMKLFFSNLNRQAMSEAFRWPWINLWPQSHSRSTYANLPTYLTKLNLT